MTVELSDTLEAMIKQAVLLIDHDSKDGLSFLTGSLQEVCKQRKASYRDFLMEVLPRYIPDLGDLYRFLARFLNKELLSLEDLGTPQKGQEDNYLKALSKLYRALEDKEPVRHRAFEIIQDRPIDPNWMVRILQTRDIQLKNRCLNRLQKDYTGNDKDRIPDEVLELLSLECSSIVGKSWHQLKHDASSELRDELAYTQI